MASFGGTFELYPHNMKKYSTKSTILLLTTLICASLTLIVFTNKYILTVAFYENNGQPMSGIPELENVVYQNIQQVIYGYSLIYIIAKICCITLTLYIGLFYFETKPSFGDIFRVVTLAEFIFIIPAAVKIWWFYHQQGNLTLEQWQKFYFLSAASLADYVKPAFLYLFQTLNVFEIAYWFLLAAGISSVTKIGFDKSLRVVCYSYVSVLFVWMMTVIFFTMMYFPQAY